MESVGGGSAGNPALVWQVCPLIHGQIRRLVLRQFPYAVYFREERPEILVIALHGRQDPRRW